MSLGAQRSIYARGLGLVSLCALALVGCEPSPSPKKATLFESAERQATPNILIVLLDDVGVDMVGAYGASPQTVHTPHIDKFAASGVLFRHAWATPLCTPTRATIQTGRYPFRTGIGTVGKGGLPLSELTLPEMLTLGTDGLYSSAAIGKWHLGSDQNGGSQSPNRAGYDHFAGTLGNLPDYFNYKKVVDGQALDVQSYATSDQTSDALDWIRQAPEPWFCYLAFNAAHRPLHTPPPRLIHSKIRQKDPGKAAFAAMVEALDSEVGRLLDGIPAEARAHTSIILLSDNGTHRAQGAQSGKAQEGKGSVHESGILVPFMIAGAGVESAGVEVEAVVDITDIFATVAEWASVDLNGLRSSLAGPLDSVSLVPYLHDSEHAPLRETAFAECFRPNGFGPYTLVRRAIRDEQFKLVHLEKAGRETLEHLFDLESDPAEERDLLRHEAGTERTTGAYQKLSAQMQALLRH